MTEKRKIMVYSPSKTFTLLITVGVPAVVIVPILALIFDPTAGIGLFIVFSLLLLMIFWLIFSDFPRRLYLDDKELVIDKFLKMSKQRIGYVHMKGAEVIDKHEILFMNWQRTAPVLYIELKHVDPTRLDFEKGDLYSKFLASRIYFDFGYDESYDEFLKVLKEKIQQNQ